MNNFDRIMIYATIGSYWVHVLLLHVLKVAS